MINFIVFNPDEFCTARFINNEKLESLNEYTLDFFQFDFGKAALSTESFSEVKEIFRNILK